MRLAQLVTGFSLAFICVAIAGERETSLASSIPFSVNNTSDAPDFAPGNGICETATGNGVCTLRAAIGEANATTGAVTVTLPSGDYDLGVGQLFISGALTINGAGAQSTTVDGGTDFRVFSIGSSALVAINSLTITGGDAGDENGGGILNTGNLTITSSIIRDNRAASGAGIASGSATGRLVIDRTAISDNDAVAGGGGGIFAGDAGSQVTITNSTISSNTGDVYSGGIHSQSGASITLTNVTVSGNTSPPPTMYVSSGATAVFTNVTFAGNNSTTAFDGAISVYGGSQLTLKNTIIHGGPCAGDATFTSLGHNIDGDDSCYLTGPGDQPATDPLLVALADNGGPTLTHALMNGSPAIDSGDNVGCPSTDQRGITRPQGAACDIGAFELEGPTVLTQGNVNCRNGIDDDDLFALFHIVAGLSNGEQPSPCPDIGDPESTSGFPWGDLNCDGAVNAKDVLYLLAFRAGIFLPKPGNCFTIGQVMT